MILKDGKDVGFSWLGVLRWWVGRLAGCLVGCPAVGEGGWEGVGDAGGLDGGVGDGVDHGDDVVAGLFEPFVGVMEDGGWFGVVVGDALTELGSSGWE